MVMKATLAPSEYLEQSSNRQLTVNSIQLVLSSFRHISVEMCFIKQVCFSAVSAAHTEELISLTRFARFQQNFQPTQKAQKIQAVEKGNTFFFFFSQRLRGKQGHRGARFRRTNIIHSINPLSSFHSLCYISK